MAQKKTHTIAVCNNKGGVGKTSTAVAIGAALARGGSKVLFVDFDAQGDLSGSLHVEEGAANIYDLMKGGTAQPIHHAAGFDVIPSSMALATADMELATTEGHEYMLKEALAPMQGLYDYIIIDTPPSLGLLLINAFTAADCVLIPMQAEFLALRGLAKMQDVLNSVQQHMNKGLYIAGILVTRYDSRITMHRQVWDFLQNNFGTLLLPKPIRVNISIAEATAVGAIIYDYAPNSAGAADYTAAAEELQNRLKTHK